MQMVGRRRRLLDYIKGKDDARYHGLIERLGIRK
jgi:small subunit ribosomal protein S15